MAATLVALHIFFQSVLCGAVLVDPEAAGTGEVAYPKHVVGHIWQRMPQAVSKMRSIVAKSTLDDTLERKKDGAGNKPGKLEAEKELEKLEDRKDKREDQEDKIEARIEAVREKLDGMHHRVEDANVTGSLPVKSDENEAKKELKNLEEKKNNIEDKKEEIEEMILNLQDHKKHKQEKTHNHQQPTHPRQEEKTHNEKTHNHQQPTHPRQEEEIRNHEELNKKGNDERIALEKKKGKCECEAGFVVPRQDWLKKLLPDPRTAEDMYDLPALEGLKKYTCSRDKNVADCNPGEAKTRSFYGLSMYYNEKKEKKDSFDMAQFLGHCCKGALRCCEEAGNCCLDEEKVKQKERDNKIAAKVKKENDAQIAKKAEESRKAELIKQQEEDARAKKECSMESADACCPREDPCPNCTDKLAFRYDRDTVSWKHIFFCWRNYCTKYNQKHNNPETKKKAEVCMDPPHEGICQMRVGRGCAFWQHFLPDCKDGDTECQKWHTKEAHKQCGDRPWVMNSSSFKSCYGQSWPNYKGSAKGYSGYTYTSDTVMYGNDQDPQHGQRNWLHDRS